MRNIALRLAYDGTHFHGSQWQQNARTVQGVLEQAWCQLTQEQSRITFSGRTDAGVHAHGQIANVRTSSQHSLETIQRALNALLPNDVSVLNIWDVSHDFHARFGAIWRSYRYLIDTSPVILPQLRSYVLHMNGTLDTIAINSALFSLIGHHNFAAFTNVGNQGTTERTCYQAYSHEIVLYGRSLIAIDLVANAFLQHMVRIIVGTLLLVGRGQLTPREFEQVFRGQDRRRAGSTVAAHGLALIAVGYPEDVL